MRSIAAVWLLLLLLMASPADWYWWGWHLPMAILQLCKGRCITATTTTTSTATTTTTTSTATTISTTSTIVSAFSFTRTRNAREIIITDAVKRIRHDGFPAEEHRLQTADGYILTMHRIPPYASSSPTSTPLSSPSPPSAPYNDTPPFHAQQQQQQQQQQRQWQSQSQPQAQSRPIVFLLAGIYASSDAWLLNGRENSLPYLLHRAGFDVWLGNNRGNIYARHNVWHNASSRTFWNFSWHELSVYDMPAMVDYMLAVTGERQLHFVGISQGGTCFLVLNSMLPRYNRVFKTATLLAPVAYVSGTKGSLARLFGPLLGTRNYVSRMLEGMEMVSTNKFVKKFLSMTCFEHERPMVCVSRLWPAVGYDTRHLNKTLLPDIMANFPVGGSFKQIMHYFQGYVSTHFRQYDYGPDANWALYNQLEPPEYELERVDVPLSIYYAQNDYIVSVEDIWRLLRRLRSIRAIYKIPWKHWNHFDFICGLGVRQYIFDKIVHALLRYEATNS